MIVTEGLFSAEAGARPPRSRSARRALASRRASRAAGLSASASGRSPCCRRPHPPLPPAPPAPPDAARSGRAAGLGRRLDVPAASGGAQRDHRARLRARFRSMSWVPVRARLALSRKVTPACSQRHDRRPASRSSGSPSWPWSPSRRARQWFVDQGTSGLQRRLRASFSLASLDGHPSSTRELDDGPHLPRPRASFNRPGLTRAGPPRFHGPGSPKFRVRPRRPPEARHLRLEQ